MPIKVKDLLSKINPKTGITIEERTLNLLKKDRRAWTSKELSESKDVVGTIHTINAVLLKLTKEGSLKRTKYKTKFYYWWLPRKAVIKKTSQTKKT